MTVKKSDQKNISDVMIVGAGVPGCLLALKLANLGMRVTIFEQQKIRSLDEVVHSETASNGRSVALMQRACNELRAFGILQKIDGKICPLKTLRIIDDSYFGQRDDMISHSYHATEIGYDAFGYNIPLQPLLAVSQDALRAHSSVNLISECDVASIDFSDEMMVSVHCEGNKTPYEAPLIVGADGGNSIVRDQAGIGFEEREYKQTALTCVISHELDHNNISTEFHRPTGPFTLVPMKGQKSAIVWSEHQDNADAFRGAGQESITQAVQERSHNVLGQIKLETPLYEWPLKHVLAEKQIAKRCALIAESAHVLSPIGAQGLNLSLRDVEDLFDVIKDAALNGLDIGKDVMLENYVSKRRVDMMSRGIGIDLFHRSVATDNPIIHKIRRQGLDFLSKNSLLRHVLMQEGLQPQKR
jgi:2-octaprenyl-6-methoxyphenol hydroxylase